MPFAVIAKATATGPNKNLEVKYTVLAIIPCCSAQLSAKRVYFWVSNDRYGRNPGTEQARCSGYPDKRCYSCGTPLGLHVLVRKDKSYEPCGHFTPYGLDFNYCYYKPLPGKQYCGLRAHAKDEGR